MAIALVGLALVASSLPAGRVSAFGPPVAPPPPSFANGISNSASRRIVGNAQFTSGTPPVNVNSPTTWTAAGITSGQARLLPQSVSIRLSTNQGDAPCISAGNQPYSVTTESWGQGVRPVTRLWSVNTSTVPPTVSASRTWSPRTDGVYGRVFGCSDWTSTDPAGQKLAIGLEELPGAPTNNTGTTIFEHSGAAIFTRQISPDGLFESGTQPVKIGDHGYDINKDGRAVGRVLGPLIGDDQAWYASGYNGVQLSGATIIAGAQNALAINDNDVVVGTSLQGKAYRWVFGSTITEMPGFTGATSTSSQGLAINNNGVVVGQVGFSYSGGSANGGLVWNTTTGYRRIVVSNTVVSPPPNALVLQFPSPPPGTDRWITITNITGINDFGYICGNATVEEESASGGGIYNCAFYANLGASIP